MNILHNFSPVIESPQYYPCTYPLLHEHLKYKGYPSYLSLFVNLDPFSIPTYTRVKHGSFSYVDRMKTLQLGYQHNIQYWGHRPDIIEFSTFDEGIEGLREHLNRGELCILSGSPYFLPYWACYQDRTYVENYNPPLPLGVTDHWLGLYGISDDGVSLFDPSPNRFLGEVPYDNFRGFWQGDRGIPELHRVAGVDKLLVYGFMRLVKEWDTPGPSADIFFSALRTVLSEYFYGKPIDERNETTYLGDSACQNLLADYIRFEQGPITNSDIEQWYQVLRWSQNSRRYLRDLLRDMTNLIGKDYLLFLEGYESVVLGWEKSFTTFALHAREPNRGTDFIPKIRGWITDLMEKERHLNESMLIMHDRHPKLPKIPQHMSVV